MKKINHLKSARRTLKIEAKGLEELSRSLNTNFNEVCNKLMNTKGKIILNPVVHTILCYLPKFHDILLRILKTTRMSSLNLISLDPNSH